MAQNSAFTLSNSFLVLSLLLILLCIFSSEAKLAQSQVQNFIKVDQTQYFVDVGNPAQATITGKITDATGGKVILTITKPDGTSEQNTAFVTNTGDFMSLILLDQNSQLGQYQISASYNGNYVGSTSFTVTNQKSQTPPPNTAGSDYKLYQDSDYGFSIEYPSDWTYSKQTPSGGMILIFSPHKGSATVVNVFYDKNTLFVGTDQQKLDRLGQILNKICSAASVETVGLTCSNFQYKTGLDKYRGIPAYIVASTMTETLPDGSNHEQDMTTFLAITQNSDYGILASCPKDECDSYNNQIGHIAKSLNIYSVKGTTNDYSNYSLQQGEWVKYKMYLKVESNDNSLQQQMQDTMTKQFSSLAGQQLKSIDDIDWIKATITSVSTDEITTHSESQVLGKHIDMGDSTLDKSPSGAIPTNAKVGDTFDSPLSSADNPSKVTVTDIKTENILGNSIDVYELTSSKTTPGDTMTTQMNQVIHYDTKTGILLDWALGIKIYNSTKFVNVDFGIVPVEWSQMAGASAQTPSYNIPSWIKNTAKWWSEGSVGDDDFVKGIQYLIQQGIIVVPTTQVSSQSSQTIPSWIKNTAKWWSEGQLGDADFVQGIQYLVQNGIISTTIPPQTIDSTSQTLSDKGGTVSLSGGSSLSIPAGTLASDEAVSLELLSSLPTQPPSGIIVGVGPALEISFGPTQTSYQDSGFVSSASAQTQPSGNIEVTLNAGNVKPTGLTGSAGIADIVDLQGKDHFVGIPENCNPSYSTCTFALQPSVISIAHKIILGQTNLNTMITGAAAPRFGPAIWNGQEFVDFPQGFDPSKRTLVVTHGMASNLQSTYGSCINDMMAAGNYDQVIGFNYDFTKDIDFNGQKLANLLDLLKKNNVSQIDLEAHSEGTVVALSAASKTSMKINNMVLEGGPIDGTPIASYGLTTALANSPVPLPIFGTSLKEMYNNGVMGQLTPGNPFLKTTREQAVSKQPSTNFIKVVGNNPYSAEKYLIYFVDPLNPNAVDPFNGEPNDGMIPVSSAMGKDLPGPTPLIYNTNHSDLTCNPDALKGVGAAVKQNPLPSSSEPTAGSTSGSTAGSTGTQQKQQQPQQQQQQQQGKYNNGESYCQGKYGSDYHYDASAKICVKGYHSAEEYCQGTHGSDYHYDASQNACVPSSNSGTSGGAGQQGGTSALGIDLTGEWDGTASGTINFGSQQLACGYTGHIHLSLTQNGKDLGGSVDVSGISLSGSGCDQVPSSDLTGNLVATIFGSGFSGTVEGSGASLSVNGQFTSDLMRGTYSGGAPGADISGQFTASRTG